MPAPSVVYQRESFHDVWDEACPLLTEHWREIAHYDDIVLDPDVAFYARAEEASLLRIYTARLADAHPAPPIAGKLIGYAVYFVRPNPHYRLSLQANQDVLFLLPHYRQAMLGARFLDFTHNELRREGVQVVYQHMKVAHDKEALLTRLGYEPVDRLYAKRLDR